MKVFSFLLGVVGFIVILVLYLVFNISYDKNCGGYLKRAADANNIVLAKQELKNALQYIEYNHLTSGYTSVLYTTPDEDIGFWYTNLKTSLTELNNLDSNATALEKSNMLMKLRETLLDNTSNGTSVTHPTGISVYPYNALMGILFWVSLCLVAIGILGFMWDEF